MSDTYDAAVEIRETLIDTNKQLSRVADCLEALLLRFQEITVPGGYERDGFLMTKEISR